MFNFEKLNIKKTFIAKIDDKEWPHYLWKITISGNGKIISTDYRMGLAHVCKRTNKQIAPDNKGIMHSLLLDAEADDMSFSDWCENYGYSEDSILAFNTYQLCCKQSKELREVFTKVEISQMKDALQDY